MESKRGSQLKLNIALNALCKPVAMLLSYIYVPVILAYIGDTRYGVWTTLYTFISGINYFDIGIGNGLRNQLSKYLVKDQKDKCRECVSTAYLAIACISIGCFVIFSGAVYFFNLPKVFNLLIENENVLLAIIICIFFVCLNFVISMCNNILYALQKPSVTAMTGIFVQILNLISIVILNGRVEPNLVVISIAYGVTTFLVNVITTIAIFAKYPYLIPRRGCASKAEFKSISTLGVMFFIMQISTLIVNSTDNLLISKMYGAETVTPYSMVYKVFYAVISLHGLINMPMWPAYSQAEAAGDIDFIRNGLKKINQLTAVISVGVVSLIFLFKPIAKLWLGRELEYPAGLITLMAVFTLLNIWSNNYGSLLCGVGYVKISTMVAIMGAVLNIPVSIFCAQVLKMGVVGVLAGSVFVMIITMIAYPYAYHKWLELYKKGKIHE